MQSFRYVIYVIALAEAFTPALHWVCESLEIEDSFLLCREVENPKLFSEDFCVHFKRSHKKCFVELSSQVSSILFKNCKGNQTSMNKVHLWCDETWTAPCFFHLPASLHLFKTIAEIPPVSKWNLCQLWFVWLARRALCLPCLCQLHAGASLATQQMAACQLHHSRA